MIRKATIILLFAIASQSFANEAKLPKNSFVLIEVFTSEGCSSCPPIGNFMNAVVRGGKAKGLPIYQVEWHVDYWNKLKTAHGTWQDPYSSKDATKRQKRYAKSVPAKGPMAGKLVTPQVVVDGRPIQQFSKQAFAKEISEGLSSKRESTLKLERSKEGLSWTMNDAPEGCELLVLLVQKNVKQNVTAGENNGKVLQHENVVMWCTKIPMNKGKAGGKVKVDLPKGVTAKNAAFIVIAQDASSMKVHAVAELNWKTT